MGVGGHQEICELDVVGIKKWLKVWKGYIFRIKGSRIIRGSGGASGSIWTSNRWTRNTSIFFNGLKCRNLTVSLCFCL